MNLDKMLEETLSTMGEGEGKLKVPTDPNGHPSPEWVMQMIVNLKSENVFLKAQTFVLYTIANKLFATLEEENQGIIEKTVQENLKELKDAYEKVEAQRSSPKLVKPSGGIITP